ncbi:hypothetical protein DV704_00100 [Meiothermus sp. QL-1]|uniref:hypothetical protein n=1 Tax=Meiothermus sp. QL-1 TaxID=2058095 RepID=UPI000E0A6243|nr:hypothetical protein [Meiothermus sp. QL-1]RDI96271.1 hypothetical protein DV704_00100 [Meiothermus sp. QL-1]
MGNLSARALWTGIFLIIVSTVAVMGSKLTPTALLPGLLGLAIALMGLWADRSPAQAPLALKIALGLAVLGLLGSLRGVPEFITLLSGGTVERPMAATAQFATVFICLAFVVRYLVESRRKA